MSFAQNLENPSAWMISSICLQFGITAFVHIVKHDLPAYWKYFVRSTEYIHNIFIDITLRIKVKCGLAALHFSFASMDISLLLRITFLEKLWIARSTRQDKNQFKLNTEKISTDEGFHDGYTLLKCDTINSLMVQAVWVWTLISDLWTK